MIADELGDLLGQVFGELHPRQNLFRHGGAHGIMRVKGGVLALSPFGLGLAHIMEKARHAYWE